LFFYISNQALSDLEHANDANALHFPPRRLNAACVSMLANAGVCRFALPNPKPAAAGAAAAAEGFKVVGGFRFKSDTSTSNPDEPLRSKDVAGSAIRGLIEGARGEEQGQKDDDGSYGPNLGHVQVNLKVREAKDLGIGPVDDDDIWILDREYDKRHKN